MSSPLVSVILTCYNHLSYIEEAITSVRKQTFQDYEFIAIDDGSTDGTRDFLATQPNIKLILNEQNLGTYASLNKAISTAQGQLIAILNDDDLWEPQKLELQSNFLISHPDVHLVGCGGHFIDSTGAQVINNPLGFDFPVFDSNSPNILGDLVTRNLIIPSGSMFRKSTFDELKGFDEMYFGSGDWDLWFKFALHGSDKKNSTRKSTLGCVNEPLLKYRVHSGGASTNTDRIIQDDLRLRDMMLNLGIDHLTKKELAFCWAAQGANYERAGKKRDARECYKASIALNPTRAKTILRLLKSLL